MEVVEGGEDFFELGVGLDVVVVVLGVGVVGEDVEFEGGDDVKVVVGVFYVLEEV